MGKLCKKERAFKIFVKSAKRLFENISCFGRQMTAKRGLMRGRAIANVNRSSSFSPYSSYENSSFFDILFDDENEG